MSAANVSSAASSGDEPDETPKDAPEAPKAAAVPDSGSEGSEHGEEREDSPIPQEIEHEVDADDTRKCSYRDFSQIKPKKSKVPPSRPGKEPTFPVKLHAILSSPQYANIISWLPHGRSWRIIQQKAFEEQVIPLFFRHGRYSSFARQVNGWGFIRITHGPDFGSYYHERFLRGMPHIAESMRRLTSKDAGARKKMEQERPPDLHKISRAHPLPEPKPTPPMMFPGAFPGGGFGGDLESVLAARRRAQMLQQVEMAAATNNLAGVPTSTLAALAGNAPGAPFGAGAELYPMTNRLLSAGIGQDPMMNPMAGNPAALRHILGAGAAGAPAGSSPMAGRSSLGGGGGGGGDGSGNEAESSQAPGPAGGNVNPALLHQQQQRMMANPYGMYPGVMPF